MSRFTVTFWPSADESQMAISMLNLQADSASHALYQAVDAFVHDGWDGDIDHVSIKKLNDT